VTRAAPSRYHQFCRPFSDDLASKNARNSHRYDCAFSTRPRLEIDSALIDAISTALH
jgi:hypothetical protein